MPIEVSKFDVAVIGAGPAGMMAVIQAAEAGLNVVLLEKGPALGKKLLLTGGGRCNLTNAEFNLRELVKNYNNGEFLFHAFSPPVGGFGPKETINFFEKIGVKTKTEDNKRVFPVSNDAADVLGALRKCLSKNKVEIKFNSEVLDIKKTGRKISRLILVDREIIAKKYILCAGGKTYPLTGSNGSGYELAEKLGHTIEKLKPALCPIKVKEAWVKNLQGIGLEDVKVSVSQAGKKQITEEGEILFTHFGISGPAILNISGKVGDLLSRQGRDPAGAGEVKIFIDLFPLLNHEELLKGLEDVLKENANKSIKNILSIFVPERLAECLVNIILADGNKIGNSMSKGERVATVKILKNLEITATGLLGFELARVTRGGVSLKEIDHKTMKSKIIDNLFFAGEIINVDGKSGGFNLQACWSTGYLAGKSSAEE